MGNKLVWSVLGVVAVGVVGGCALLQHQNKPASLPGQTSALLRDKRVLAAFKPPSDDGLITNEYAYFNPQATDRRTTPDWKMTSGSLFAHDGTFWTGKPDSCDDGPDADSTNCTNSNVFRLNSSCIFSGNVAVNLMVRQNKELHNPHCDKNDSCWHGAHIWLRYQSEYNLYYASVNRADGNIVIKRKVPCGDDNDGTYVVLGSYQNHDFKTNEWNDYIASVRDNADKSVSLGLYDGGSGKELLHVTDKGGTNPHWSPDCKVPGKYPSAAYPPLTEAGAVGLRGDYADMYFKLTVYEW